MRLPVQSRPAERTTTGQPRAAAEAVGNGQGIQPSGNGVAPNGVNWGQVANVVSNLLGSLF